MLSFFYALKHNSLEQILFYSGLLIVLLILLSVLTGAGFNRSLTLTGFSPGKNILGQNLLAYLILIFLYIKVNDKPSIKLTSLAFFFVFLLFLTTSKTSILLFCVFLFIGYVIPRFSRALIFIAFISLLTIFILIPCLSFYMGDIIHIGQYISQDAITGRGLIWDMLYIDLSFYQKMDFGYGYGTYFNTGVTPIMFDDPWSFLSRITSTHNGYIDMLMQFGFYGCLCILFVVCFLSKNIKNHWLISTLFIVVIYNFTEASFFRDYSMMWLITLVVFSYKNSYFDKVNNG
jgi:O-antigen ligase